MADVDILLVEDNRGDTYLVQRTFDDRELPGELHIVETGEAALDWLYQRDEFEGAPRPDLVLLDLNLPATSGRHVLEEIKSDPALKRIPVIILTGAQSDDDLLEVYDRYANAALIKPVDPDAFGNLIQSLTDFWVSTAVLPPPPDSAAGQQ